MIEHTGPISGVAAGPAGLVATAGYDNRLILWREGRGVSEACHEHLANQCAFDAGGTRLVSASSDYTARIWQVPDLRLMVVLGDHEDDVEMAVFSPAGDRVATASRDHRVRIFDSAGRLLHRMAGHAADVISVTWTHGGEQLVSSGDDGTVRYWDANTGALLRTLEFGGETDTVVVAPDGRIFAGNDHGEIVCHDARGTYRVQAHRAGIKRLAADWERDLLVSSSYDRALHLWKLEAGTLVPLCSTTLPPSAWARAVAPAGDGRVLVGTFGSTYATFDPSTQAWDLNGGNDTRGLNALHVAEGRLLGVGDAGRIWGESGEPAAISGPGNFLTTWRGRLVAGGHLGTLYDVATGAHLHQHTSPLNCAAVLADGDLVVGTYTGEGLRFGVDASLPFAPWKSVFLRESLRLHEQAVKGVAVSGDHLFSVSAAGDAALRDLRTGAPPRSLPGAHERIANGVCALSDGRFATVSRDLKLRLWTGETAERVSTPCTHSLKCVTATADGRFVVVGAYDGTVAFHDLQTGTWPVVVRPTRAGISSLCPAPGGAGDTVLASAYDGGIFQVGSGGEVDAIELARSVCERRVT